MLDLNDPGIREDILDSHPIIKGRSLILTPMIEDAYKKIREKVWLRHSGLFLYAQPRMGKTSCLTAVQKMLNYEYPEKYTSQLEADGTKSANFMKDLVKAAHLFHKSRELYPELLERYLGHVEAQLAAVDGDHFILLIDEMQNVSRDHYGVLLTIHNRLKQRKISMTTVGFAQPQILNRRSSLFVGEATNLIARFLSEPVPFPGCVSKDYLRGILKSFDQESEFPEGSGWTYTRFFFPSAFAAGFKLGIYLDLIWGALSEIDRAGVNHLPMEHVFRIIEHLLLANRRDDSASFRLDEPIIKEGIDSSGVRQFVELMKRAAP